jgi:hypothetical protein
MGWQRAAISAGARRPTSSAADIVVVVPPSGEHGPCVSHRGEHRLVEAFVVQAPPLNVHNHQLRGVAIDT